MNREHGIDTGGCDAVRVGRVAAGGHRADEGGVRCRGMFTTSGVDKAHAEVLVLLEPVDNAEIVGQRARVRNREGPICSDIEARRGDFGGTDDFEGAEEGAAQSEGSRWSARPRSEKPYTMGCSRLVVERSVSVEGLYVVRGRGRDARGRRAGCNVDASNRHVGFVRGRRSILRLVDYVCNADNL